jgi:HSP20 family protein
VKEVRTMTMTKSDKLDTVEKVEVREDALHPRRFFDRFGWPTFWPRLESLGLFDEPFVRVEEFEDDHDFVVRAEVPGIDPDKDLDIHVSDHTLHIEAEREETKEFKETGRYRSEFRYGNYTRTVPLPAAAHGDDVKATYKDGILEVRMPVDRRAATTKVPVQHL